MNTLTGIEAERVSQILRHAIDRLHILTYVPTYWDENLLQNIQCDPVMASLERQFIAEENIRGMNDMIAEGGKDISIIKQAHRATRATCRNLMVERESLQILMDCPEAPAEEFTRFIKYLGELKSQINTRMTTTVEDEAASRTTLHELTDRERLMEESRDALKQKLAEVRDEKEHVTLSLDQMLKKLQLELQDITQHNAVELDTVSREMSEAIGKATADHEQRMRQLQDQVDTMERQTQEIMDKNREEEVRLRKEKGRNEATLNAKIAQYDEDMAGRHKTLNELQATFKQESDEYASLKEYFDKIDWDLSRGSEELSLLRAVARRREFGERILFIATATIQKIVRGRIARAAYEKMKSKKKKGKGKKGGKKKK